MKYFKETFIKEIHMTELDLDYPFYNEDDDDRNEVQTPDGQIPFAQVPSVDIDELIEELYNLKLEGANRVYIADHVDHHGYHIYGVKLEEIEKRELTIGEKIIQRVMNGEVNNVFLSDKYCEYNDTLSNGFIRLYDPEKIKEKPVVRHIKSLNRIEFKSDCGSNEYFFIQNNDILREDEIISLCFTLGFNNIDDFYKVFFKLIKEKGYNKGWIVELEKKQ